MTSISILGTVHVSEESSRKVATTIQNGNFDVVFVEGINSTIIKEDAREKPLLIPWLSLLKSILKRRGKDFKTAYLEAQKKNIPVKNIDLTLKQLVQEWRTIWKWFFVAIVFAVVWFLWLRWNWVLRLLVAMGMAWFAYAAHFVLSTITFRNTYWVDSIKHHLMQQSHRNALLICGERHVVDLAQKLRFAGFAVRILS